MSGRSSPVKSAMAELIGPGTVHQDGLAQRSLQRTSGNFGRRILPRTGKFRRLPENRETAPADAEIAVTEHGGHDVLKSVAVEVMGVVLGDPVQTVDQHPRPRLPRIEACPIRDIRPAIAWLHRVLAVYAQADARRRDFQVNRLGREPGVADLSAGRQIKGEQFLLFLLFGFVGSPTAPPSARHTRVAWPHRPPW